MPALNSTNMHLLADIQNNGGGSGSKVGAVLVLSLSNLPWSVLINLAWLANVSTMSAGKPAWDKSMAEEECEEAGARPPTWASSISRQ